MRTTLIGTVILLTAFAVHAQNLADAGTNGDVFMSSPAPYTRTGLLFQAKPSWPYIVAKTGTSDSGSGFLVNNSSNVEILRVNSDGFLQFFGSETFLLNRPPDGSTPSSTALTLGNRAASGGNYLWRWITASSSGGASIYPNALELYEYPSIGSLSCCIPRLWIRPATVSAPKIFTIDGAGQIGIGVVPAAALHVNGNARFDGTVTGTNIQAHYQDVAEWVPSQRDLAPGTVVVLDAALGNGVRASAAAYDTTVAGVVSAQPGIVLGEAAGDKEMIATTGRVRVRVDARQAPIAVGDLLVTSEIAGMAMKSEPTDIHGRKFHQPGTIIGKALEPLSGGQGEILVLLSLQ